MTTGCLILHGFSTGAKLGAAASELLLLVNSASVTGPSPDIVTDTKSQDVQLMDQQVTGDTISDFMAWIYLICLMLVHTLDYTSFLCFK